MNVLWGIGGMVAVLAVAVLFSVDRRRIRLRTVAIALAIQLGFAVLVLAVPWGQRALTAVSTGVQAVISSSNEGIEFVFGPVLPEDGSVFAFQVLPVIIFFASLTAVLYYLGILQQVVRFVGGGLQKLLGTSQPESMNAAANIFVGQTEAPLVIRPYLARLSQSELFAVMVGGLATVAGSVLVGYTLLGAELEYLIAASFMAAPGALLMAKLMVPEGALAAARTTGRDTADAAADAAADDAAPAKASATRSGHVRSERAHARRSEGGRRYRRAGGGDAGTDEPDASPASAGEADDPDSDPAEEPPRNVIDAAARGASDGLTLALNVGAMLLAFISLIALANLVLGWVGGWFGLDGLTIQQILGYVFSPVMWAVGVPWAEATQAGSFLGQKIVLNEFVAFGDFAPQADQFSPKAAAVITFALTGFANLGSLAILLGGLGGLVKKRRGDIASLGLRAVLAGTLANLMSAAMAGMLIA